MGAVLILGMALDFFSLAAPVAGTLALLAGSGFAAVALWVLLRARQAPP